MKEYKPEKEPEIYSEGIVIYTDRNFHYWRKEYKNHVPATSKCPICDAYGFIERIVKRE